MTEVKKLRICMVLESTKFPNDVRVAKESRALLAAGHEVFLITLSKGQQRYEENINGVHVRFLPNRPRTKSPLRMLIYALSFIDPMWVRAANEVIRQHGIDVLHVHDLALVKTGSIVARKRGIPLVADLHENYPEGVREWRRDMGWLGVLSRAVFPVWRFKRLEKTSLKHASNVLVVCDESWKHYEEDCHVPREKLATVLNTVDVRTLHGIPLDDRLIDSYRYSFVISYIGGYAPHRGLKTTIYAMRTILESVPTARLIIVGHAKPAYTRELQALVEQCDVAEHVEFVGYVDFEKVPSYITLSDVCLVPHEVSGHTNSGMPHKFFQYMSFGKPVVVSNCIPMQNVVETYQAGIVFSEKQSSELARSVIRVHSEQGLASVLGEGGKRAVKERYNWDHDARNLCGVYATIAKRLNPTSDNNAYRRS